jgi:hypothetical protein
MPPIADVASLRLCSNRSAKDGGNPKFMLLTALSRVRDVAFLRPCCERAAKGYFTRLDSQFSSLEAAGDYRRAPEKEKVRIGYPTSGSGSPIEG